MILLARERHVEGLSLVDLLTSFWTGYQVTDFPGRGNREDDEALQCCTSGVRE